MLNDSYWHFYGMKHSNLNLYFHKISVQIHWVSAEKVKGDIGVVITKRYHTHSK